MASGISAEGAEGAVAGSSRTIGMRVFARKAGCSMSSWRWRSVIASPRFTMQSCSVVLVVEARLVAAEGPTRQPVVSCAPPWPFRSLNRPGHVAVTGVDNRVSTIGSASVTLPPLGVRYTRAGSVAEAWCTRHGFAPNRLRLIAAASGLMTESASESSRSTHASTPRLVPEHAAMLRRGDSRLGGETPVNAASRANPEFRRGTVTR